ncbi:MAG: hypothetical protein AB7O24_26880 [Kofleriaceae bacterium]
MRSAFAITMAIAACYGPKPPQGVPCGADGSCPAGQACIAGVCGGDGQPDDAGHDAAPPDDAMIDGSPLLPSHVAHLSQLDAMRLTGASSLNLNAPRTFNTSTLIATPAMPANTTLFVAEQLGGGEVVVIDVSDLLISADFRVIGSRPLIFVATGDATIAGVIDAGGRGVEPGAGGYGGSLGPGAGEDGPQNAGKNAGGGGGGYATNGAAGGPSSTTTGGGAGVAYGDVMVTKLDGGSGGGHGLATTVACGLGGGGGGAVQITADVITLNGGIRVGGGGGGGGRSCSGLYGAGGGAGAGGAVYLQATSINGSGDLSALGGGGGEGGDPIQAIAGDDGDDGPFTGGPASGGTGTTLGGNGGNGGGVAAPTAGGAPTGGFDNGGGGGGAAGRLFLKVPDADSVTLSCVPACERAP